MKRRQVGAVLLVALLMLLMLTLLALTGMRAAQLEFRLVGNGAEQRRIFNAAESALREGERRLARMTGPEDGRGEGCRTVQALCVLQVEQVREVRDERWRWLWQADPQRWWAAAGNARDYRGSDGLTRFEPAPRLHAVYFASDGDGLNLGNLGEAIPRTDFYYVDAYASDDSGRSPVVLQSVYARRYSN